MDVLPWRRRINGDLHCFLGNCLRAEVEVFEPRTPTTLGVWRWQVRDFRTDIALQGYMEGGEYVIEGYTNSEADALVEADDWAELAGTGRGYDDS